MDEELLGSGKVRDVVKHHEMFFFAFGEQQLDWRDWVLEFVDRYSTAKHLLGGLNSTRFNFAVQNDTGAVHDLESAVEGDHLYLFGPARCRGNAAGLGAFESVDETGFSYVGQTDNADSEGFRRTSSVVLEQGEQTIDTSGS